MPVIEPELSTKMTTSLVQVAASMYHTRDRQSYISACVRHWIAARMGIIHNQ